MGREDFLSCISMERHEGVPSFLFDTSFGTGLARYDVSKLYENGFDGRKSAESIIASKRFLGHDAVIGSVLAIDSEAFGVSKRLFPDRMPMVVKPAFEDPQELFAHSPEEADSPAVGEIIRSFSIVRDSEPDAVIVSSIPSPFLEATTLRGTERFLMDLMSDKEYAINLIKFASEIASVTMELVFPEIDAECGLIPCPFDNAEIIGFDALERLSIPSMAPILRKMEGEGMKTILHPHGVFTDDEGKRALESMLSLKPSCLYYGENNDHRTMAGLCRGRCSVMGGANTYTTIFMGPDERVEKDTEAVLDAMSGEPFIYSCSCSVDRGLDVGRMKIMMDTVRGRR